MFSTLTPVDGGGFTDAAGCHYKSRAEYLYSEVLHLCGCGEPASIARYVSRTLRLYTGENSTPPSYEDLPVMFLLYWADHEGFVEHGTTVRCCWLTAKGKALLQAIDQVQAEEAAAEDNSHA